MVKRSDKNNIKHKLESRITQEPCTAQGFRYSGNQESASLGTREKREHQKKGTKQLRGNAWYLNLASPSEGNGGEIDRQLHHYLAWAFIEPGSEFPLWRARDTCICSLGSHRCSRGISEPVVLSKY